MAEHSRLQEAHRWLVQARHDLQAASWNVEGGFHDIASFLAQQAAEKIPKPVHYYPGTSRRVLLSHSGVTLV